MRRSKASTQSFNLIEMVAVAAVLVVISGVGLPHFIDAVPKSNARPEPTDSFNLPLRALMREHPNVSPEPATAPNDEEDDPETQISE